MLRSLKSLEHYKVSATDGDVGSVVDFFLEDERWTVRYLVVETGSFFVARRVLVSPISFRQADFSTHRFHLALTSERVKHSPSVDLDKPVSRQHERDYYGYYGYPYYWAYNGIWGTGSYPPLLASNWREPATQTDTSSNVHLRSAKEVRGYDIRGTDAGIGHVDDFIVDDSTWQIRYLVIDTSNWWFGNKVLISPEWATNVSWVDRKVHVEMSRRAIEESPMWDPSAPINRDYEMRLHDYYGRPVYWSDDAPLPAGAPVAREPSGAHAIAPR